MAKPNLYIFSIGGTGSRVLKSLMFLLASGVKINTERIIPIIIDPDFSNGDLNRTYDILKNYSNIKNSIDSGTETDFFSVNVDSVGKTSGKNKGSEDYRLLIKDADNKLFNDFIGHSSLEPANKEFMNLLFSESNLNSSMDIGFKGNPNIGSVVLNQLFTQNNDAIRAFSANFKQNDRIFIISSIFGGTGAAGFPLVLKNLRNIDDVGDDFANTAFIKDAKIGALTVLPYFGVAHSEDNLINKSSFVSKSRAALKYYYRTVNKEINALYYIGDDLTKDYDNNPGAIEQKNLAHFVELAGALSIIDFMNITDTNLAGSNIFKEFGITNSSNNIDFSGLDKNTTQKTIKKSLTKLFLMKRYLDVHYNYAKKHQPWTKRGKVKFEDSTDIKELLTFLDYYEEWFKELSENNVSFSAFNLTQKENIKDMINGQNGKNKFFKGSDHFVEFDKILNKTERDIKSINTYSKLLELFDKSTEQFFNEAY